MRESSWLKIVGCLKLNMVYIDDILYTSVTVVCEKVFYHDALCQSVQKYTTQCIYTEYSGNDV